MGGEERGPVSVAGRGATAYVVDMEGSRGPEEMLVQAGADVEDEGEGERTEEGLTNRNRGI